VPIIGLHLYFNAPAGHDTMRRSHLIFTDGCVRWAFAKGVEQGGEYAGLHHIHVVIGALPSTDKSSKLTVCPELGGVSSAVKSAQRST